MKTRPAAAELFNVDGRTDMTEPVVAFRNFANAPKTGTWVDLLTVMSFSLVLKRDEHRQYTFLPCVFINDTCSCISAAPYLLFVCKLSVLSHF